MLVVLWQYEVRLDAEADFEALYGRDGAWVELFRDCPGYIDTQLLRAGQPRHYLTIDRWASAADYDAFLGAAHSRYAQINARGDTLTLTERCFGRYETPC
ncbi:MAG: antibiotic biosynthesis monooxygenase family protein [Lysobacter sp.]